MSDALADQLSFLSIRGPHPQLGGPLTQVPPVLQRRFAGPGGRFDGKPVELPAATASNGNSARFHTYPDQVTALPGPRFDARGRRRSVMPLLKFNGSRPVWSAELLHTLSNVRRNSSGTLSPPHYPHAAEDIALAMQTFLRPRARRLRVAVFSAITPWVEAALLGLPELQHANLTTIDWNQPILAARHTLAPAWRRLRTLGQAELARHYARGERFDAIVAFSGIEHDGLGRYGDPLNPEGDLAAISEMGALLARGGLLLLGVPTAVLDDVVYPRHRLYGPGRLPWLLRGWTLLGRVWDGRVVRGGLETAPQPPSLYGEAAISQHDRDYIFTHQPVLALSRSGL